MSPANQDDKAKQQDQAEVAEDRAAGEVPQTDAAEKGAAGADAPEAESASAESESAKPARARAKPKADESPKSDESPKASEKPEAEEAPNGAEAAKAEEAPEAAEGAKPARTAARTTARAKKKTAVTSTEVKVDLPAAIFDANVNVPLIHQVVVAQQAAARQGTHSTKTRGDVRGGGRKPYRQKGTGRARQGSVRAPQFAGGGTVHGPEPRSYAQKTPKKMKAAALRGALSDRARHGLVQVVGGFVDGETPKTAHAVSVLAAVTGAAPGAAQVLVVADSSDQVTWKSLRNATGVHLIDPGQLNTYDVLTSDRVIFTSAAFESFVARSSQQEER
jgi:large subunit ribosomal protein L4